MKLDPVNAVDPSIKTRSGVFFHFLNPTVKSIHIDDIVHALSHLCRFNGHTRNFFSVAQHSYECADLSLRFSDDDDPDRQDKAYACLLHDAHEAYIGDVTTPLKAAWGKGFRDFETPIVATVNEALGLTEIMEKHHEHVKEIDRLMLHSDAIRWGMDGVITDRYGAELSAPREWVPPHFKPYFEASEPLSPRAASAEFYERFFELNGGNRVASSSVLGDYAR